MPKPKAEPGADDPRAEWVGMPECVNEDGRPYRSLHVHFAGAADVARFAELLGLTVPPRRNSLWYPPRPMERPSRNPYVG